MKGYNIDKVPTTNVYLGDYQRGWQHVPNYIFSSSPEDYTTPFKTYSWVDENGERIEDKYLQKCILKGSFIGIVSTALKEVTGIYAYHYYLADKLGKRMARQHRASGRVIFCGVSSDPIYSQLPYNSKNKYLKDMEHAFKHELYGDEYWKIDDRFRFISDMKQLGNTKKTLIVFAYLNDAKPETMGVCRNLLDEYVKSITVERGILNAINDTRF